jgi:arginine decarboxylase
MQITNIRVVKEAMSEAAYLYAELVNMGARMHFIDCGGGLGVDYDGSNTDTPSSLSYTMQVKPPGPPSWGPHDNLHPVGVVP